MRQNLDPARFAAATGLDVLPVVVEATEAPIPDDGLVRAWPAPDFGIDTHRDLHGAVVRVRARRCAAVALVPSPAHGPAVPMADGRSTAERGQRRPHARADIRSSGSRVIALAPIVASYVVYYFFPRAPSANYGTLLPTARDRRRRRNAGRRLAVPPRRSARALGAGRARRAASAIRAASAASMQRARRERCKARSRTESCGSSCSSHAASRVRSSRRPGCSRSIPGLVVARVPEIVAAKFPGRNRIRSTSVDPLGNLVLSLPGRSRHQGDRQGPDAPPEGVADRLTTVAPPG